MKLSVLIPSIFIGALLGSAVTYSVLKNELVTEEIITTSDDVIEPVETLDIDEYDDEEPDDYYRLLLTDPTNLSQRDLCVAMWYSNEVKTVDYLRVNTGHEFGDVWNQRSPVEILEEQLVFWKGFFAESRRLELERVNSSKDKN